MNSFICCSERYLLIFMEVSKDSFRKTFSAGKRLRSIELVVIL